MKARSMGQKIRIAVAGAGQIGRRHVEAIVETRDAALAAIVDPAPGAAAYAADHGVPHDIGRSTPTP
jgi:predicted dehydrogenase